MTTKTFTVGVEYRGEEATGYATVTPGRGTDAEITLHGTKPRWMAEIKGMVTHPYSRTFRVGETVEYDSYNLSYTGVITSIGKKTVTVDPGRGGGKRRLTLHTFNWRNWDFDAEETAVKNREMMVTL